VARQHERHPDGGSTGVNLKEALVRTPGLAADSVVGMLSDGPCNTSYLVKNESGLCVLRIDKPLATELGLDREAEHDIIETASLAGIGAQPLYFDGEHGISLRQYLPGRTWHLNDLQKPEKLQRLASRMRDLHALPPVGNVYEPGLAARRYARQLGTREAQSMADQANLILAELHSGMARECLCHNDLVAGNILESSNDLKFIDWEYAGLGDPWFDLALVVEHHQLSDELQSTLVQAYLQREPRSAEMTRLLDWRRFYRVLLVLWNLRTGSTTNAD
jgi:thiamine kinase